MIRDIGHLIQIFFLILAQLFTLSSNKFLIIFFFLLLKLTFKILGSSKPSEIWLHQTRTKFISEYFNSYSHKFTGETIQSFNQQSLNYCYVPGTVWDTKIRAINRNIPVQKKFKVHWRSQKYKEIPNTGKYRGISKTRWQGWKVQRSIQYIKISNMLIFK